MLIFNDYKNCLFKNEIVLPSRQILVPRTSQGRFPFHVPRTFPKDLTYWASWGSPEMTSRGRPDLTFKGRPWEVDLGLSQDVLRKSPRGP